MLAWPLTDWSHIPAVDASLDVLLAAAGGGTAAEAAQSGDTGHAKWSLGKALGVLGVVPAEHLAGGRKDAQGDQAVALAFDSTDHLTGEAAGETVGLDQDQGALSSHAAHPIPPGRQTPARVRAVTRRCGVPG